jgi:hypothetical protein
VVHQGEAALLSGNSIPVKTFSLRVRPDGSGAETRGRGPFFVVTRWQGGYRLLGLRFAGE